MNTREPTANPSATFKPRLDILPPAQQRLWPELSETPEEFTLYAVDPHRLPVLAAVRTKAERS
jgi:hypothetical protein